MGPSSCFMLYEDGMNLVDVTCGCGCGYWDIFSEKFIKGEHVRQGRGGRPSRAEYEAVVKAKLSPEEYEARLREQFITHFFKCATEAPVGAPDPTDHDLCRRRALAELDEIGRGDFESRGRTAFRDVIQPPLKTGSGSRHTTDDTYPHASDVPLLTPSRHRDREVEEPRSERDAAREYLKEELAAQNKSVTSQQLESLVSQYLARQKAEREAGSRSAKPKRKPTLITQFLPGENINLLVLQKWLKDNMAAGASVREYTHKKDGKSREGFLVEADRALDTDMIADIKEATRAAVKSARSKSSSQHSHTSLFPAQPDRHGGSRKADVSHDLVSAVAQMSVASARAPYSRLRKEDDENPQGSDTDRDDSRHAQRPSKDRQYSSSSTRDTKASRHSDTKIQVASRTSTRDRPSSNAATSSRHATSDPQRRTQSYISDSRPRITQSNDEESDSEDSRETETRPPATRHDVRQETPQRDRRAELPRRESRPEASRGESRQDASRRGDRQDANRRESTRDRTRDREGEPAPERRYHK